MPKVVGPIVGISFTEDSIQAVAVRRLRTGSGVEVTQVATAPIPAGAMDGAIITDRPMLAGAVREMLLAAGITAKFAVIGLPSRAVFSRTVTIPQIPDSERRNVVRGEIDHLNILPPGQGTFDYVVFAKSGGASENGDENEHGGGGGSAGENGSVVGGKGQLVLFFAAEQRVAQDYWTIGAEAGLEVVGLEPAEYAAVRSVYPLLSSKPLALAISVGSNNTHLQFLRSGRPVFSRRIDVGIQQMSEPEVVVSATPAVIGWHSYNPADEGESLASGTTRANAARHRLAQEIGRSIEYFGREYVADLTALSTVLLPNDLGLTELPSYVTAALEQPVEAGNVFGNVQIPARLDNKISQEEAVSYAPALGLALGPFGGKFAGLPVFDLSLEASAATRVKKAPKVLTGAIAAGVGVLAAGAIIAVLLSRQDAPVRLALASDGQALKIVKAQQTALQTSKAEQEALVRQIQSKNLPWTNVLRHLAVAVPSGMGLTNVSAQGTTIAIAGETATPDWIPAFWTRMNQSAFFTGATVSSITHSENKIAFQMTATLPTPVVPAAAGADPTTALSSGVAAMNVAADRTLDAAPAGKTAGGG